MTKPADKIENSTTRRRLLTAMFWLFLFNCLIAWINGFGFLEYLVDTSLPGIAHFTVAFLSHFASFTLIVFLFPVLLIALFPKRWILVWIFPVILGAFQYFFYLDRIVYDLFRFHFNGTVITFFTTPGLEDSIGLAGGHYLVAALILVGFILAEYLGARVLCALVEKRGRLATRLPGHAISAVVILLLSVVVEKGVYAGADIYAWREVTINTQRLPFYQPVTCKSFAKNTLGVDVDRNYRLSGSLDLNYPLNPVTVPPAPKNFNIIWIALEGWRFDMMRPDLTPNFHRLSERSLNGEYHFSSGNCSRFGIFGMFYGLHGFYWHSFLTERQGPVFIRLLKDLDYEMLVMGAANFNSPPFRKTCFVDVPPDRIFDSFDGKSSERDLAMVDDFIGFLEGRNRERPFFSFMFFDSSHGPYNFQELPGFQLPFPSYSKTVNYRLLPHDEDARRGAFNRYGNAIAYIDFLFGKLFAALEGGGYLDNTIIMISGDHGEEFGENGYYMHNAVFDDYQVRTPLIFYYPGVEPGKITRMTSHVDWVPTTLRLLGVEAEQSDYCQGLDILGEESHDYVVSASWNEAAVITMEGSMVFPLQYYRLSTVEVMDRQYQPVADRSGFLSQNSNKLFRVLESSRTFKY